MFKRAVIFIVIVLPLLLLASACGSNLSGEPEVVFEQEVQSLPTATPRPTLDPTDVASATAEAGPDSSGGVDLASADYDLGFELYLAACAQCHGARDASQGPSLSNMRDSAPTRIAGVTPEEYVYQSIVDPGAYIVEGYSNIMPGGFAAQFSAQEVSSLVKFILEFDPASMMGGAAAAATPASSDPGTTANNTVSGETLIVSGRLVQGTTGGAAIPPGLDMELYVLNENGELIAELTTTSADDGTYTFADVPRAANNMYLIQTRYSDVPQGAQIHPIQGNEDRLTQDVTLYERTTDPSSVAITWAQMLINFAPIEEFGLEIWLQLELINNGDQIVTSEEAAGDWFVSARLELPVGAFGIQPMQSEDSQRFIVVEENGVPVVKDTWPLRPGQVRSIVLAYYLPYENGAVIDQVLGYPVIGGAVLIPNDTVQFTSSQFDAGGDWRYRVSHGGVRVTELQPGEKVDPDEDFTLVKAHDLLNAVGPSDHLIFELAGRPTRTLDVIAAAPQTVSDTETERSYTLPMILGGAGLAAIALGLVLWWRQRSVTAIPAATSAWTPPALSADKETLLKAIATLDDAFEAGLIEEDIYEERRAILAERLLPLLDKNDRSS
jgi:mono/diheme cytochrome c family protein